MSSNTDSTIHIHTLHTGNEQENVQEDVFEITGNGATSLITPNSTNTSYDVSQTSFVIGSDRLNNDPSASDTKDRRMFFDKPNGAFRVGTAESTQWNPTNRGTNSAALGLNNKASGANSFAVGNNNTASGLNSFAAGYFNHANGPYTVAIGNNNTAAIGNTVAIGLNNIVSNAADTIISAAIGASNTITQFATGSFAIGTSNGASGPGN